MSQNDAITRIAHVFSGTFAHSTPRAALEILENCVLGVDDEGKVSWIFFITRDIILQFVIYLYCMFSVKRMFKYFNTTKYFCDIECSVSEQIAFIEKEADVDSLSEIWGFDASEIIKLGQ